MYSEGWIALGAIGTLLIVAINLVLILIIPLWKRPKFSVEFRATAPFCRQTMSQHFSCASDRACTYWIRLKVKNSGRSVAKRCLGRLTEVMDENCRVKQEFDPTQLHWSGSDWEEVPFRTTDLDRDDYEYLDLLTTQENNTEIYFAGDQFPWAPLKVSRAIPNSLPPGKYILCITVYGDDVKPVTKYASLVWGGANIKDVSIQLHDNLRNAKSWLGKQ